MKLDEFRIRDPFILYEGGVYYLYGTNCCYDAVVPIDGFYVYTSTDLENWSEATLVYNSPENGTARGVHWAPEVYHIGDKYYMFATMMQETNMRGTYSLVADSPMGPFRPLSDGALTPKEWESLDGTLYFSKEGKPYLIFCHEHRQIIDGTMCYAELSPDFTHFVSDITVMFAASEPYFADPPKEGRHFVTDGPFMFRTKTGELLMIWSTFVQQQYHECLVRFKDGELGMDFEHLPPLITDNGGHGMIFEDEKGLHLTYHYPNTKLYEHAYFCDIEDLGDNLKLV